MNELMNKKILIVDDEKELLRTVSDALFKEGFFNIYTAAWGEDYYGHENTLTVHIRRLREKLEDTPSSPKYLLTVRGLGYRLAVRDE